MIYTYVRSHRKCRYEKIYAQSCASMNERKKYTSDAYEVKDRGQTISQFTEFFYRDTDTHTYRGIIKASRRFSLQCLDSVEQGGVGVSLLVVKERESGTKTSKKLSHFPSLRNFEGGVSLFLCLFLRLSVFVLSPIRFCANFLIFQEQKLSFGMLSWIKERKMTFYSF